jgi:hypothetical protein
MDKTLFHMSGRKMNKTWEEIVAEDYRVRAILHQEKQTIEKQTQSNIQMFAIMILYTMFYQHNTTSMHNHR